MEIVSLLDDINDECYSIYFPDVDQHQILNNTYFAIEKKSKASRKDNNKSKSKNKCNKLEWFESLEVHQRLEAVSTIFTDDFTIINQIKKEIRNIEKNCFQACVDNQINSNEDIILSQNSTSLMQNYTSNFDLESHGNKVCPRFRDILENITFLDFKEPEDTISMTDTLVKDANKFFKILNETWQWVRETDKSTSRIPSKARE